MCVCVGGGALELVCLAGVTDCLTFAGLFIENVFFSQLRGGGWGTGCLGTFMISRSASGSTDWWIFRHHF